MSRLIFTLLHRLAASQPITDTARRIAEGADR